MSLSYGSSRPFFPWPESSVAVVMRPKMIMKSKKFHRTRGVWQWDRCQGSVVDHWVFTCVSFKGKNAEVRFPIFLGWYFAESFEWVRIWYWNQLELSRVWKTQSFHIEISLFYCFLTYFLQRQPHRGENRKAAVLFPWILGHNALWQIHYTPKATTIDTDNHPLWI